MIISTLVDKSFIQGLSFEKVEIFVRYYSILVPPILMRELISMLAKSEDKKNTLEQIQNKFKALASKVESHNSYITQESSALIISELLSGDPIELDGKIPMFGGERVRSRDGTIGMIFKEPPQVELLRSWSEGKFSSTDLVTAKTIRAQDHEVDFKSQQKSWAKAYAATSIPKFKSLDEILIWVDDQYNSRQELDDFWVESMTISRDLSSEQVNEIKKRIKTRGKRASELFPYTHFCYRLDALFTIAVAQGLLTINSNNKLHLDINYLYYLPFCKAFVTSDRKLLGIANLFKRDDQRFIYGDDLKVELESIISFFSDKTSGEKATYRKEFGDWPPKEFSPITTSVWSGYITPHDKTPRRKKSAQENKTTVEHLKALMDAIPIDDVGNDLPIDDKNGNKSQQERILEFIKGVFEIIEYPSRNWKGVKRDFDENHVRRIYNLHAELWRPNTNYKDLSKAVKENGRTKFLYLGDINPNDLYGNINRLSQCFDQILIVDPFRPPWSTKRDFNPIADPSPYLEDTFKMVYMLKLLEPLILSEKVIIIENPTTFDYKIEKQIFDILYRTKREKYKNIPVPNKSKHEFLNNILRSAARLNKRARKRFLQSALKIQDTSVEEKLCLEMIKDDPITLNSKDARVKQNYISRLCTVEVGLILCALYGATAFSSDKFRKDEFEELSINKLETQFPMLFSKKMDFKDIAENKRLTVLIKGLSSYINNEMTFEELRSDSILEGHLNELEPIAKQLFIVEGKHPSETLQNSNFVFYKINPELNNTAMDIVKQYDESFLKEIPNYFIGTENPIPPWIDFENALDNIIKKLK